MRSQMASRWVMSEGGDGGRVRGDVQHTRPATRKRNTRRGARVRERWSDRTARLTHETSKCRLLVAGMDTIHASNVLDSSP